MFIGEGPGESEDETGRPFVGRAGQLLSKMITAMGLTREQVYIANVVKCRPPGNRTPAAEEVAACTPYLVKQIQTIRPKVIVTLGLPATQYILSVSKPMRDLRGTWHEWHGIKVMPTYHPSYVLRSYTPEVRGTVWGDLQKVMEELGLPLKATASSHARVPRLEQLVPRRRYVVVGSVRSIPTGNYRTEIEHAVVATDAGS